VCQSCNNGTCGTQAQVTCFADNDGDGHGNPADVNGTKYCGSCPQGTASNNDDCNDSPDGVGPTMYPGNQNWYPDTLDHDCSGTPQKLYACFLCPNAAQCNGCYSSVQVACGDTCMTSCNANGCPYSCGPGDTVTQLCR